MTQTFSQTNAPKMYSKLTLFFVLVFQPVVDKKGSLGTKIDWHDWETVGSDLRRQGPGENGSPIKLTPEEEMKSTATYIDHGFSAYVSDKIAIDRAVPDIRHNE